DVRVAVAVELAELNTRRSIQEKLACHLVIEARVHLFESLVGSRIVHPIVPEGAANADRHFWQPIVVSIQPARYHIGTDVIGIEEGRGIELTLQKYFPAQLIICPRARVEDVDPRGP